VSDTDPSPSKKGSFWATLPGILTGIAAVIGSVAALIALFHNGPDPAPGDQDRAALISMPDIVDDSEKVATEFLRGRNLDVSKVTRACSDRERGTVLRQEPLPGKAVDRTVAVSLVVSTGRRPGQITDPQDGAALPDSFPVRGKLCPIPEGRHVYLAVRTDGLYPEAHEIFFRGDGRFTRTQSFPNPRDAKGGFTEVLLYATPEGRRAIEHWLDTKEPRPALPDSPELPQLDFVDGLRLQSVG
jgi:hypothetical protein